MDFEMSNLPFSAVVAEKMKVLITTMAELSQQNKAALAGIVVAALVISSVGGENEYRQSAVSNTCLSMAMLSGMVPIDGISKEEIKGLKMALKAYEKDALPSLVRRAMSDQEVYSAMALASRELEAEILDMQKSGASSADIWDEYCAPLI